MMRRLVLIPAFFGALWAGAATAEASVAPRVIYERVGLCYEFIRQRDYDVIEAVDAESLGSSLLTNHREPVVRPFRRLFQERNTDGAYQTTVAISGTERFNGGMQLYCSVELWQLTEDERLEVANGVLQSLETQTTIVTPFAMVANGRNNAGRLVFCLSDGRAIQFALPYRRTDLPLSVVFHEYPDDAPPGCAP